MRSAAARPRRRRAISAFPRASPDPVQRHFASVSVFIETTDASLRAHEFLFTLVSSHDTSRRRSHVSTRRRQSRASRDAILDP